jgi:hypothetical protein
MPDGRRSRQPRQSIVIATVRLARRNAAGQDARSGCAVRLKKPLFLSVNGHVSARRRRCYDDRVLDAVRVRARRTRPI